MAISNSRYHGIANGYRSGLEDRIATELTLKGVQFKYEPLRVPYTPPMKEHTYTPDIILENGVVIELKGRFISADRVKHIHIKREHPLLDIRFVFQNPMAKLSKGSHTTYADWCQKNGFQYAKGSIPDSWITEKPNKERLRLLKIFEQQRKQRGKLKTEST